MRCDDGLAARARAARWSARHHFELVVVLLLLAVSAAPALGERSAETAAAGASDGHSPVSARRQALVELVRTRGRCVVLSAERQCSLALEMAAPLPEAIARRLPEDEAAGAEGMEDRPVEVDVTLVDAEPGTDELEPGAGDYLSVVFEWRGLARLAVRDYGAEGCRDRADLVVDEVYGAGRRTHRGFLAAERPECRRLMATVFSRLAAAGE